MTAWAKLEKIGSGSTGEVWRVQSPDGRFAALKQAVDSGVKSQRRSLRIEVEALARLHHPHIPDLIEADLDADPPYLVMTLAEGEALNVLIATGALWSHPIALRLDALDALADALQHIHERGLIHRDIKPSNMRGLHHPLLLDFGLACDIGEVDDPNAGTHAYMPPAGEPPSPAADRYAFAVSVYHLLFGAHPTRDHHRTTFQAAQDRADDAAALASGAWRRPTTLPPAAIPGDLRGADLAGLEALFIPAFSADVSQRPVDIRAWLREIRACIPLENGAGMGDETAPNPYTVSVQGGDAVFTPPPALPDFTAQQAAGFDDTQPPLQRGWWAKLIQWLKGALNYKKESGDSR